MVWFQEGYTRSAPLKGGTYSEGMLGPIKTLNPLYAQSSAELSSTRLLFSSLFDYDKNGYLRNSIAESISLDATETIYTVKLREDVKWHDGTNVTAQDVAFTADLMKNPSVRAVMQPSWRNVDTVALDTTTVQFTLPSAYAPFKNVLTFSVLPKHILESIEPARIRESAFSLTPVGSGPFSIRLLQDVSNSTTTTDNKVVYLSAFDNYFRGRPKLDRFEIHSYDSSEDIAKALRTRDVNAAIDVNESSIDATGIEASSYDTTSGVYAIINTDSPLLKELAVRRALQKGTDTDALRSAVSQKANNLDYPFIPYQVDSVTLPNKPTYDVAQARAALDKAGWKLDTNTNTRTKKKQTLEINVSAIKTPQYEKITRELTKQWSELGIKTNVTEFDASATSQSFLESVLQPRAYDVLINELSIGADPDVYAYWHSSQTGQSGLNLANYTNDVADELLLSSRIKSDPNLRDQKYKNFASQWLSDVPAIGLYQSYVLYPHTKKTSSPIEDSIMPTTADRYTNVLEWTADEGQVYKTP